MQVTTLSHDAVDGWSGAFPGAEGNGALVLAFAAPEYRNRPAVLRQLADAYAGAVVAGCSTAGEILGTAVRDDSIAVGVVTFDHSRVKAVTVGTGGASFAAGHDLGSRLHADDLRAVLVLSEGIDVNGTELAHGLTDSLGPGVVVTGGLAGDGDRFESTWVLHDGDARPGMITAVGLYGADLEVGYGFQGGWDIFGPERIVTRSRGNVLYELDGKPALDLYKRYLGDLATGLPASALRFPLALKQAPTDEALVRTVLAIDEATQSMTFAGDIPEGAAAQLMQANFDRLIEGAELAASGTGADGDDAVLAIAVSCVGRRLVLGGRIEEETEATMDVLPPATTQIGFYSYGELSPDGLGSCELHNQTMTLTTIRERTPHA